MTGGFVEGAGYVFKGLRWLLRPGVRNFVAIPLLVNLALFGGGIALGAYGFNRLLDWLHARLPAWLYWLDWLLWPLFFLGALMISFYAFNLLANLLAAPFNSLLAERVEKLVNPGAVFPPGRPLWREVLRTPGVELKKLIYYLLRALPALLPFLLPVVNALAPLIWGAFVAWMLALQYMDYPLGNHGIPVVEQRRLLGQRRLLTLGFGSAVLLLTMIPVVNFLAMPSAVIGASLLWAERFAPAENIAARQG